MMRIFGERAEPMSASLAEDVLVERAQNGERAAFDELVRRHFARIHGLAFRLVGNHEDAEDLAQECFVRAFGALRFYRADASFSTWLYRIALHLARDARRRRREVAAADLAAGPELGPELARVTGDGPSQGATQRELVARLAREIDALPENLRESLVLRVLEGLEYEDVARVRGVRLQTARTHVMRARRELARRLAPWLERREP